MRRASWMSLGMMVTRLAWMAQRLVSSKRPTSTAWLWNRRSVLKSWAISRTRRWKGSFRIRSSVLFWYLRISRSATVPGLYLCGFFTPPVVGADFLAACNQTARRRQRGTGGAGAAWAAGDAWTKAASCDRWESGSGCEAGSDGAGWAGENTRSVGGSRRGGDWWAAGEARIGDVAIEMGQRCQRPPGVGLRVSWAGLAWARPRNAHLVVVESVLNSV
ncbi:hypothetical protein SORBI_3010G021401 [Sorghum bicolor]|uniref:Secreted protein n=1 Tax=Sorghum bicolor TaxID=4558 RepID=A0A1W0VR47_SORBI|nr:hypothetical protein SORBI_3010G021401 [Sorghum bicolor]